MRNSLSIGQSFCEEEERSIRQLYLSLPFHTFLSMLAHPPRFLSSQRLLISFHFIPHPNTPISMQFFLISKVSSQRMGGYPYTRFDWLNDVSRFDVSPIVSLSHKHATESTTLCVHQDSRSRCHCCGNFQCNTSLPLFVIMRSENPSQSTYFERLGRLPLVGRLQVCK